MADHLCPRCGEPLDAGAAECAYCAGHRRRPRLAYQPLIILIVVAIAAGLWIITHFVTQAYAARQAQLARQWFDQGELNFRAGRLAPAIADLATALAYSHEDFQYRLRLAEALAADHQDRQARAYLLALWDEQPGNGTVNVELARLAARTGDFQGAVRYYHDAIYGVWTENPAQQRRDAHLELIQFLLRHKARQQAESELIALAADLPHDPALLTRVADLFMTAGEYDRAFAEYREALDTAPRNTSALAGAGEAAFELRHYAEARRYLRQAVAENPQNTHAADLLQTSDLVLQLDPFQRRLPTAERDRRVLRNIEQAQYRLEKCAAERGLALQVAPPQAPLQSDYAQLLALKRQLSSSALRRHPDLVDTAMDAVFGAERHAAAQCGAPSGPDFALLLIARQHESAEGAGE